MNKKTLKYLIIIPFILGVQIFSFSIKVIFSSVVFVRLISVVLIIFLSGAVGASIRQALITRE